MTLDQFRKLSNFHEQETDIYKRLLTSNLKGVSNTLMRKMDNAITLAKEYFNYARGQFIVHDINSGNHSGKSLHYEGKAIDGSFVDIPIREQFMLMLKAGFTGVGCYTEKVWTHPGIHADIRSQPHVSIWLCNERKLGKQIYEYNFRKIMDWLLGERHE